MGKFFKRQTVIGDSDKKNILNQIIDKIVLDHNPVERVHHLDVHFKIPLMFSDNVFCLKTSRCSTFPFTSPPKTLRKSIPPQLYYSTVTEQSPTVGNLIDFNTIHNLVMNVRLTSSNLWLSPYSQYQQKLFNIIRNFKEEDDWTFKQISDWLVENDYRTPRDKTFTHKHVWSMYTKKKRSIERFNREYEPVIKNVDIDIVD